MHGTIKSLNSKANTGILIDIAFVLWYDNVFICYSRDPNICAMQNVAVSRLFATPANSVDVFFFRRFFGVALGERSFFMQAYTTKS